MKPAINVLEGSVGRHMLRMAIPSMGGMFAITVFNLTDTYFVSRLGTDALAAMGFTFPVVMLVGAAAIGLSRGSSSVLARAVGAGDRRKARRIATDGILLALLVVLFVSVLGILFTEDLFRLLGAEGTALDLVVDYMTIWFAGAVFAVIPPVSDASMRALGDMVRPLGVMVFVALLNIILDPILIFGYLGFPAMGIRGAVIATIIARAVGGAMSLWYVGYRYRLFDFRYEGIGELAASWKEIALIGLPNVINRLLPQLIRASMTRLVAGTIGVAAVAAIAAGQRIESFATIASIGVGTTIIPIMGQSYGSGRMDRVMETRRLLIRTAVGYGLLLFVLMLPLGRPFAGIFTDDPEVLELVVLYLRIIMIGTIGLNHYNWISEAFNAVGKPRYVLLINLAGTLLMILPMMYAGIRLGGYAGLVIGLAAGQIAVGLIAILLSHEKLTGIRT